ncbi:unnamed protein product [Macrosiphum euphorbiae]|uniref:Uncharacterized protein n=1 Tax=Macrosiphum euphorbiae TaxID=13131 RepID=A0AAV0WZL1_9HEMI|nr:unnamed protein product [Macrosiphum euphorbiae]
MKTVADYTSTPHREQRHGSRYWPLGPLFRFRLYYCYHCSEAGNRPCALETSAVPERGEFRLLGGWRDDEGLLGGCGFGVDGEGLRRWTGARCSVP